MKPKLSDSGLKVIIPSTRGLLQTIQRTLKTTNLPKEMGKAKGRTYVNLLCEMTIKKSILNIHLIEIPMTNNSNKNQSTDSSHLGNRGKGLFIIYHTPVRNLWQPGELCSAQENHQNES
ncbi:hypothetical protein CsSME_00051714 [Camellia sinensis var. sinensis]